jgi:hypothetical protein
MPVWVPEGPCHCSKKLDVHAEAVIHPEFSTLVNDIREPSTEGTAFGGKFYSEVWMNIGREIADEAIRQNEEESHLASE